VFVVKGGTGSQSSSAPQPAKAKITAIGQTVAFDVDGRAGQLLTAIMTPEEGFAGDLRLVDDRGAPVGRPSAADASRPVVSVQLPADGHYRVEARGRGDRTGSFAFASTLQTMDTRNALAPDTPTPGTITGPERVDVYTFTGRAGAVAEITMKGDDKLYDRLVVVGPNGQGFFDENTGGYGDAFVAMVLPDDGVYEVRASSARGAKGAYRLDLVFPGDVGVQTGTVTGSLDRTKRHDVHTIRSQEGADLRATLRAPGASLILRAADGGPRTDIYVGSRDSAKGFDWVLAPATTYLLEVRTDNAGAPYSFSVALDESVELENGRAQGVLRQPNQIAVFRLDDRQGNIVSVLVSPVGQFDPVVEVIEPSDATLIKHDGSGRGEDENFTVQLRSAGPHLLAVSSGRANEVGAFTVSISQRAASSPG